MRPWLLGCLLAACSGDVGGAGPGGAGVDAPPGGMTAVQASLAATNMYRAMNGKPALADSAALDAFADTGAMVDFSSAPHTHFTQTDGGGIAFAENECPVQGNWMLAPGGDMAALVTSCIAAFYAEGPGTDYSTHGHYINMMGDYATLGTGVYQMGTGVTITQDYGN